MGTHYRSHLRTLSIFRPRRHAAHKLDLAARLAPHQRPADALRAFATQLVIPGAEPLAWGALAPTVRLLVLSVVCNRARFEEAEGEARGTGPGGAPQAGSAIGGAHAAPSPPAAAPSPQAPSPRTSPPPSPATVPSPAPLDRGPGLNGLNAGPQPGLSASPRPGRRLGLGHWHRSTMDLSHMVDRRTFGDASDSALLRFGETLFPVAAVRERFEVRLHPFYSPPPPFT